MWTGKVSSAEHKLFQNFGGELILPLQYSYLFGFDEGI
jgi:hypothetical protein